MADDFTMDASELKAWKKFMFLAPRIFSRASANVLNKYAFGSRKMVLRKIRSDMTVRNDRFVSGRVQVEKARAVPDIGSQFSVLGSVGVPRFSGWIEQETGEKADDKNRFASLLGRGGSKQAQIKPGVRLKPGKEFPSSDSEPGGTPNAKATAFLFRRSRSGSRAPFFLKGHRKIRAGLYRFRPGGKTPNRRLQLLQGFHRGSPRVKRVRWLSGGVADYMRRVDQLKVWERAITRALPRSIR